MDKLRVFTLALSVACMPALVLGVNTPTVPAGNDAGAQLNQTWNYFEQQWLQQELQDNQKKRQDAIDNQMKKDKEADKTAAVSFTLKQIIFDSSDVFKAGELDKLAASYIGKAITLQDLQKLIDEINDLYQKKGYVVCRAYLPQQTIHEGVLHVSLIEGKTGNINVEGNKSTRKDYITNRLPLQHGMVSNLNDLTDQVQWFNSTNDVQLHVKLQPGTATGTTDYVITANEPSREHFYVTADTAGSASTGIWREGVGWYSRSLSGVRDSLNVSFLRSDGMKNGSVQYVVPISDRGTKLGLQYSNNSIKIKDFLSTDTDMTGHSTLYGFTLMQPLMMTINNRWNADLEWTHQHSQNDWESFHWTDDTIKKWTFSVSGTHYGKNTVFYHRHSYSIGNWEDIGEDKTDYGFYSVTALGQKVLGNRQYLTVRLNGQISNSNQLPSANQFYIGGMASVRGYKENILGGESGYSLNVEYAVPDRPQTEWLWFADVGEVYGDSTYDDHMLASMGMGYRARMGNWGNGTIALGIPLKRNLSEDLQSNYRVHVALYSEF